MAQSGSQSRNTQKGFRLPFQGVDTRWVHVVGGKAARLASACRLVTVQDFHRQTSPEGLKSANAHNLQLVYRFSWAFKLLPYLTTKQREAGLFYGNYALYAAPESSHSRENTGLERCLIFFIVQRYKSKLRDGLSLDIGFLDGVHSAPGVGHHNVPNGSGNSCDS